MLWKKNQLTSIVSAIILQEENDDLTLRCFLHHKMKLTLLLHRCHVVQHWNRNISKGIRARGRCFVAQVTNIPTCTCCWMKTYKRVGILAPQSPFIFKTCMHVGSRILAEEHSPAYKVFRAKFSACSGYFDCWQVLLAALGELANNTGFADASSS